MPELQKLDALPRQPASHVKNKWGDVVRQVAHSGSVAITSHSTIEMVLMEAGAYQQLVDEVAALKSQQQGVIDQLTQRFDARLAELQQPGAAAKVDALFNARGKLAKRPKAGASY